MFGRSQKVKRGVEGVHVSKTDETIYKTLSSHVNGRGNDTYMGMDPNIFDRKSFFDNYKASTAKINELEKKF